MTSSVYSQKKVRQKKYIYFLEILTKIIGRLLWVSIIHDYLFSITIQSNKPFHR